MLAKSINFSQVALKECVNYLPYCYLFKRVPILANFSEFGKIANNSIR